jgi:hypothetical protein
MREEEIETLLNTGITIDKKWEPYALEHATRSREAFQEQMNILDEIHTNGEESTRKFLRTIICDLENLQMEQQREVSFGINAAIEATRSVISNILHTTREYVKGFERTMATESHAAMHKISHMGLNTMTESPDVRPTVQCPEQDLHQKLQEQNEYSAMFWDLRVQNVASMIESGISGMSSMLSQTSTEMESIHASCAEQESHIEQLKASVASKKEYIQNLVEKIKQTDLEMDRLRQDQQQRIKETTMIKAELVAAQNAHQKHLEDISYETTIAIKELERIVIHFERMASIPD